jgi:uroporphyrinogen-III synthase
MKKRVLITRSEEENQILKDTLEPIGFSCVKCSLIHYQDILFDYSNLEKYTDIIITSKHAANIVAPRRMNAFVVGEISARILREKGYIIKCIASNVNELKNALPKNIDNKIIYLSGNIITTEMPNNITRKILYNVRYSDFLPTEIQAELKIGIDFILLYSKNSAKTLIKLVLENDLFKYLNNTIVISISPRLQQIVRPYFTKNISAGAPDKMIQVLKNYVKQY